MPVMLIGCGNFRSIILGVSFFWTNYFKVNFFFFKKKKYVYIFWWWWWIVSTNDKRKGKTRTRVYNVSTIVNNDENSFVFLSSFCNISTTNRIHLGILIFLFGCQNSWDPDVLYLVRSPRAPFSGSLLAAKNDNVSYREKPTYFSLVASKTRGWRARTWYIRSGVLTIRLRWKIRFEQTRRFDLNTFVSSSFMALVVWLYPCSANKTGGHLHPMKRLALDLYICFLSGAWGAGGSTSWTFGRREVGGQWCSGSTT